VPFGLTFDSDGFLWIVNGTQVLKYDIESD